MHRSTGLVESINRGPRASRARRLTLIALTSATIIFLVFLAIAMAYYTSPKGGFPGTKVIANHSEIQKAVENKNPAMIYFSSMGCPTCLMQDRAISAVYPKYEGKVKFVYILLEKSTEKVFEEWSVVKVPTIVFADSNGMVISRFDGRYLDEGSLRAELERLK